MRYLCLVYFEPNIFDKFTPAEGAAFTNESLTYDESLMARGLFVDANALQSTDQAKTVRVRNGKASVTDGPFAETREVLGGYVMVEAPNIDEALKAAAGIPLARLGSVEVRPILQLGKT
ncbi:MAG: YciI family protein [Bauldia sp.]